MAVLGALLALTLALPLRAETPGVDAHELLARMATATKGLNYDGIFVYQRGEQSDTMRIIHRADDGNGERERLVSLTGAAREVIRDGEAVRCYFPEDRAVMVEKARPRKLFLSEFAQPLERIAELYQFSVAGRDRVAGRSAWVVAIHPRGAFRYGYRLWVDEDSGLLLRSHVVDVNGTPLEQIIFTQIDTPATIPDALLEPELGSRDYTLYTNEPSPIAASSEQGSWVVNWLPEGFVENSTQSEVLAPDSAPVRHMVFTDGLAIVSVFVEKAGNPARRIEGFSSMGAVNAFSMLTHDHQVTVVGEVPPMTVRQIASSVAPTGAGR